MPRTEQRLHAGKKVHLCSFAHPDQAWQCADEQSSPVLFKYCCAHRWNSGLTRQMPVHATEEISAVETGQMSAVETGQMSAVETGQMSSAEAR